MSRVPLGVLLGLIIGVVNVALMLPLSFPELEDSGRNHVLIHAARFQ